MAKIRIHSEDSLWSQFFDAICVMSVFGATAAVYVWSSDICQVTMDIKCESSALEFFAVYFNPFTLFFMICASVISIFSAQFFKAILIIFFGTTLMFFMVRGVFLIIGGIFGKLFGGVINTSEDLYVPSKDRNDKEGSIR